MKHFLWPLIFISSFLQAQPDRWQQRAEYNMYIDFSVENHQFKGDQKLVYYNNSPDTLDRVFYHLYFNAFEPGSMMDIRSRTMPDPDRRVGDRIYYLTSNEIGFQDILSLTQNGKPTHYEVEGTILEVELAEPILPGSKTTFDMNFRGQVPIQIRRAGRDNSEGIDYSMAQWYPKMCEYDYQGWHANPYIGREFYGVWGDFDVTINIHKDYIIGASGVLGNAQAWGYGSDDKKLRSSGIKNGKRAWRFIAENVHDFVWAADRDYTVKKQRAYNGTDMYFLYQPGEKTENWNLLPGIMGEALKYMNKNFGEYPYPVYSFIQAGDGGMEYPMATLITGNRGISSLVGVSIHEWMHSWYQMVLGSNESLYAWMDEGFTDFGSTETMNWLRKNGHLTDQHASENPFLGNIDSYVNFALSGIEEPLSTHSDHFITNSAYGRASYTKGNLFLKQLEYIVGKKDFRTAMLRYYNTWKFKHPNDNDVIRIFENVSGLELDWYKEYWINSTHRIDLAVYSVNQDANYNFANIFLVKEQRMPMPADVLIKYNDGSEEMINIPLRIMRGQKDNDYPVKKYRVAKDWPWTNPVYVLELSTFGKQITEVMIDPEMRTADVNRENNRWVSE